MIYFYRLKLGHRLRSIGGDVMTTLINVRSGQDVRNGRNEFGRGIEFLPFFLGCVIFSSEQIYPKSFVWPLFQLVTTFLVVVSTPTIITGNMGIDVYPAHLLPTNTLNTLAISSQVFARSLLANFLQKRSLLDSFEGFFSDIVDGKLIHFFKFCYL